MSMDDRALLERAVSSIADWFGAAGRSLPWRQDPTPYHVWISEIMLQQTRIEAVIPYYARFLDALPDVKALAEVPEDRLLKLWEGLGYYSRARNLKKAAVMIMERYGGSLPADAALLRGLPGIGDYTAGAVASIAFGLPEPAVDGNVLRVCARLLADSADVLSSETKRRVTSLLRDVYPADRARSATEGLMELGEVICLPNGAPLCGECPAGDVCRACAAGTQLSYPYRSPKPPRRIEERTVLLLRCRDRWAVRKRPDSGLLAGLWEFPNVDGALDGEHVASLLRDWALEPTRVTGCGRAKHVFTHVEWRMTGFLAECGRENDAFQWKTAAEIAAQCPIPTAFRAYRGQIE